MKCNVGDTKSKTIILLLGCRRFRWILSIGIAWVLLLIVAFGLFFGNPQWHKWIFMFQAYVLNRSDKMMWNPPDSGYNGIWVSWDKNGNKLLESRYKDGKKDGVTTVWYDNGNKKIEYTQSFGKYQGIARHWENDGCLIEETEYKDGEEIRSTDFYQNGLKRREEFYRDGEDHGVWTEWNERGKIVDQDYYLLGTKTTRQGYLAACAKDPSLPKPPDASPSLPPPNGDGAGKLKEE